MYAIMTCEYASGECSMKRPTTVVLGVVAAFAGAAPTRSEEQLPISELYPCEVVLHELIADMNRLRVGTKRRSAAFQSEEQKERAATYDAAVQAWDEAIMLAKKKIDRCP
jgi:hypothetical protein